MRLPFFVKDPEQVQLTKKSKPGEILLEQSEFVDEGKIVDKERLQSRQKLIIFPFRAGVNVEATDELDRISLMIVKGISDTFDTDRSGKHDHFQILTAESTEKPDIIIKGHIIDVTTPSQIKKWLPAVQQKTLGITGKVMDNSTGETIVVFKDAESTNKRNEDHSKLGYRIGENIGKFIFSGIE